ncbi:ROK family transcriptional regulator [Nocardia sp. CDC153]|uniref:ROK family transcriptional regulator n=1 Tax=Nocardia sp. CDC153 TaxID=3112167 RepID=UPI002DBE1D7A|nr:ROK family transcriptional regulator [Nocardia sp. CDC153]MEC3953713.1 ROK family transcriptional regulator [Nocardia sp. CDC153]
MTPPTGPVHLRQVRTGNLQALLTALLEGPASRAELAQRIGLTKATIANLVEPLLRQRILIEDDLVNTGRGRPSRPLRFSDEAPVAVGAEINVRHLAVTVQRLDGSIAADARIDLDNRRRAADDLIDRLAELIRAALTESGCEPLGIGLAVPGIMHADTVVHAPNVPSLTGVRIGDRLASALGAPTVLVDNEANLAALAHVWPRRLAGDDFVYVSGDVGIGAGIILDGTLFRGRSGFAGELGHVVIERAGRPCTCGSQGCVEQYAGLQAILTAAGQPRLDSLCDALRAGDIRTRSAVNCAGSALGVALSSLVNLCDVGTIVLGGSYTRFFDDLVPGVRAELGTGVLAATKRPTTLAASPLGSAAVSRGAAALITRHCCLTPQLLLAPDQPAPVSLSGDRYSRE